MSGDCNPLTKSKMDATGEAQEQKDHEKLNKLIEYETMVTTAEDKCSQLKGQLERIKQLYANQTDLIKSVTKPPASAKTSKFLTTDLSKIDHKPKAPKMLRQNSRHIGTDNTGAALGTINNILAGITKTIEMPQLFHKIKELNSKTSQDLSQKLDNNKQIFGVENVKINSKSQQALLGKSKSKNVIKRTPSKVAAKTSSIFSKKTKKLAAKSQENKVIDGQVRKPGIPLINMKSRKILRRIRAQAKVNTSTKFEFATEPNDLVEIYHNAAVKESKSSETDVPKKRVQQQQQHQQHHHQHQQQKPTPLSRIEVAVAPRVPPLNIDHRGDFSEDVEEPEIEEVPRIPECKTAVYPETSRNYEMPTVSSRMKKVAKYYMNSFNIKCIPFCPVSSIGPSHNIGLNIQQVMSMVKNKQPALHLSPTLAYNIGLAAGRWEPSPDNPLNTLVSSMTSRIYSNCPLTRSVINYQHLQEVAKTIPEKIIEEVEETNEEVHSPETQSLIITGPSGDIKVNNRKQAVWSADLASDRRCTCAPQKGVEFQQIINKFNGSKSQKMERPSVTTVPSRYRMQASAPANVHNADEPKETPSTSFQNKEQKLKEVLKKLHDEFEGMTKTYEDLHRKCQEVGEDQELTKRLESLDKELNSKEEEIVMVMTLYKEVIALKQQVKTLKEKTSTSSFSVRNSMKSNGDNSTATTSLLNKLLKQVQHFQTNYKKN